MLRVATWNVHRCVGSDGRRDPERVATVLHEIGADVIALQELDTSPVAPDGERQAEWLARRAGASLAFGFTCHVDRGTCEFGNAILTTGELQEVRQLDLSRGRREPRGALLASIRVRTRTLRVLTAHLGLRAGERRRQVAMLLQALEGPPHAGLPHAELVVLMGDVNEWLPWSRNIGRVHRRLGRTPALRTYPAGRPLLALDRIWVAPRALLRRVHVHATPLARRASDHLPVVGEIAWSTTCPDPEPS